MSRIGSAWTFRRRRLGGTRRGATAATCTGAGGATSAWALALPPIWCVGPRLRRFRQLWRFRLRLRSFRQFGCVGLRLRHLALRGRRRKAVIERERWARRDRCGRGNRRRRLHHNRAVGDRQRVPNRRRRSLDGSRIKIAAGHGRVNAGAENIGIDGPDAAQHEAANGRAAEEIAGTGFPG